QRPDRRAADVDRDGDRNGLSNSLQGTSLEPTRICLAPSSLRGRFDALEHPDERQVSRFNLPARPIPLQAKPEHLAKSAFSTTDKESEVASGEVVNLSRSSGGIVLRGKSP